MPCFNTSHVVVYQIERSKARRKAMFQYISCCSLSVCNTFSLPASNLFQYISCCSLSMEEVIGNMLSGEFQYISCCSLSQVRNLIFFIRLSFNTSHVVVYPEKNAGLGIGCSKFQYISCCSLSLHVARNIYWFMVSIHLMLQFIPVLLFDNLSMITCFNTSHVVVYLPPESKLLLNNLFQYISCCSLSIRCLILRYVRICFNTSHVVVYRVGNGNFQMAV